MIWETRWEIFIFRMNSENFLLLEFQPFHTKNCHDFPKKLKWHIEVKIEIQKFWEFILDKRNSAGDFEFLFSRNWLYLLSFEMSSSGTMLNLIIMKFSQKKSEKKNEKNIEILNSLNFLRNYFDSDLKSLFWFYLFDFKF